MILSLVESTNTKVIIINIPNVRTINVEIIIIEILKNFDAIIVLKISPRIGPR